MIDFTKEEIGLLIETGYTPGFMMDIREGDLVAIAPVLRTSFDGEPKPVKTFVVQRMMKSDGSYYDTDSEELVRNVVIHFIGIDLDGLPEHCAYGSTYPCFYKREEA